MAKPSERPFRSEVWGSPHPEVRFAFAPASTSPLLAPTDPSAGICAPPRAIVPGRFEARALGARPPDEPVTAADLDEIRHRVAAMELASEAARISAAMAIYRDLGERNEALEESPGP